MNGLRRARATFAGLLTMGVSCRSLPPGERHASDDIRAARTRYTAAWNAADTAGLGRLWMGGFRLYQQHGVQFTAADLVEQAGLQLRSAATTLAVRAYRPRAVHVNLARRVALEEGEYRIARTLPDGRDVDERGRYAAQWTRGLAGWKLQAELLGPVSCRGAVVRCDSL